MGHAVAVLREYEARLVIEVHNRTLGALAQSTGGYRQIRVE